MIKLLIPGRRWKSLTEGRSLLPLALLLSHPTSLLRQPARLLRSVACCRHASGSRGVTLLPGPCSSAKGYLHPAASRRLGCREPQGWLPCYSDRWTPESCDWQPALYLAGNGRALFLSREVRLKPLTRTYRTTELKGFFAIPMTSLSSYPSWDDISLSPCQSTRFATAKCISNRVLSA